MSKQKSAENSKQSSPGSESKQSAAPASKSGKDAASHTKADSGKGAGGGAKQGRKH
jgi:hypothetical protein